MNQTRIPVTSQLFQQFPKVKPVFNLFQYPIINDLEPIQPPKECPICYSIILEIWKPNPCEHYFCKKFIARWSKFRNQCPLCRRFYDYLIPI